MAPARTAAPAMLSRAIATQATGGGTATSRMMQRGPSPNNLAFSEWNRVF